MFLDNAALKAGAPTDVDFDESKEIFLVWLLVSVAMVTTISCGVFLFLMRRRLLKLQCEVDETEALYERSQRESREQCASMDTTEDNDDFPGAVISNQSRDRNESANEESLSISERQK